MQEGVGKALGPDSPAGGARGGGEGPLPPGSVPKGGGGGGGGGKDEAMQPQGGKKPGNFSSSFQKISRLGLLNPV